MKVSGLHVLSLIVSLVVAGCGNSQSDFDVRSKVVVSDVASVIVVKLGVNQSISKETNYNSNTYRNTSSAITGMSQELNKSQTSNAITKAFETVDGETECIIVHKAGISGTVFDHELGHCFSQVLFTESKYILGKIKKYDSPNDSNDYSDYLYELFAELSAATRSFYVDGNFNYIDKRSVEIDKKGSSAKIYKISKMSLEGLREYLRKNEDKEQSPKKQIENMINNYYLKEVLTYTEFNKALQRTSR